LTFKILKTNYELRIKLEGILTPTNFENYELTNDELATSSPWLGVEPYTQRKGHPPLERGAGGIWGGEGKASPLACPPKIEMKVGIKNGK